MIFRRSSTLFLVLLVSAGLSFAACGEDTAGTEQNQEQQNQETDNDNGDNDDLDCVTEDDCDDPDEICQGGECIYAPGTDTGLEGGLADPTPTCDDSDTWEDGAAPDRCEADNYEDFEFGPGSHISQLAIAGDDCCIDFTGDGEINNELDEIVNIVSGFLDDDDDNGENGEEDGDAVNDLIQEAIDDGDLNLVLEHDGLEEIEAGQEFDINFLFATDVTEDGATIDTASFDSGTHPHALLPDAEIVEEDGMLRVNAGPGSVVLSLDIGGLSEDLDLDLEVDLTISNAVVEADMVGSDSSIEDGVVLENGELGGLILFEELLTVINDVASDCDCLGNPDPLFDEEGESECDFSDYEDSEGELTCSEDEELCGMLDEFCGFIPIVESLTDVDTDDSGETDAFSAGIEFSTDATIILGVADEE